MRMYELWRIPTTEKEPERLEDPAGGVLFARTCDAERYCHGELDRGDGVFAISPVTVGLA